MFAGKKNSTDATDATDEAPEKPARFFDRALKWVTALTAIISLFFAVQKVTQTIDENASRAQKVSELLRVATMQQQATDYARAWDNLTEAAQVAGSGDALAKMLSNHKAESAKVRAQREELAMAWLMDIRVPDGKQFADIVDKLVPVLEHGTANAAPQHKADLIAHIGWSYFLRNRDGHSNFDPSQQYAQAVALDPNNPYAHAYWGHLLAWRSSVGVTDVREHFNAALRSGRNRERVRDMQLIANHNQGEAGTPEFLRTVVEMRKNGEAIPKKYHGSIEGMFENACGAYGADLLRNLKANISGDDLTAVYRDIGSKATEQNDRTDCFAKLK